MDTLTKLWERILESEVRAEAARARALSEHVEWVRENALISGAMVGEFDVCLRFIRRTVDTPHGSYRTTTLMGALA